MEARLRSLAFTTNYTHVSPSRKVFPSNRSFLIVTGPTISNRVAFFVLLSQHFKSRRFFFSLSLFKSFFSSEASLRNRAIKDDLNERCSDTVVSSVSPGRRDKTEVETSFLSAEMEEEICFFLIGRNDFNPTYQKKCS